MPNFELPFPFGGLNDNNAQSKQPSGTSSDAVNVRGIDPITGRVRGAQRSGLLKYTNDSFEARVKRFEKVVYDNRQLNYGVQDPPKLVWENVNANTNASTYGVVDSRENLYVVDAGRAVQKFNKNGVLIYTITPNIEDQNLHIRGLAVDGAGNLWIATGHQNPAQLSISPSPLTSAAALEKSKIWRYRENDAGAAPEQVYAYSPKLTIEKLVYSNGLLYAAANDPKLEDGYAIVYGDLFTTGLDEFGRRKLPYPLCDIDVDGSGKVYFAAAENTNRYNRHSATYPYYGQTIVDWTPSDIPAEKLWSWYDSTRIVSENNERITAWEDSSGNSRDLGNNPVTETGPRYQATGWLGQPCIEFDGNSQLYSNPASQPTTPQSQASSRTGVPNYSGAKWALSIVFRPQVADNDNPITDPAYLCGINTSQTEKHDLHVTVHKTQDLIFPGTVDPNKVTLYATPNTYPSWNFWVATPSTSVELFLGQPSPGLATSGNNAAYIGAGKYRFPASATLSPNNNASVLTIVYSAGTGTPGTDLECHYRFNGQPIDRWRGAQITATMGFYLGRQTPTLSSSSTNWFKGQVAEIVALHNLDSASVPAYPRSLGLASKTQTVIFGADTKRCATGIPYPNPYGITNKQIYDVDGVDVGSFSPPSTLGLIRGDVVQAGSTVAGILGPLANLQTLGGVNFSGFPAANSFPFNAAAVINPASLHSVAATYTSSDNTNASLVERVEGYLAWKWGIWPLLPRGNYAPPTLAMETTYNPGNWPHPFRNSPPSPDTTLTASRYAKFVSPLAVTGCLESITGNLYWITDGFSGDASGMGLRVKHVDNATYTMGNSQVSGSTTPPEYTWSDFDGQVRKLTYNAATDTLTSEWKLGTGGPATFFGDYLPHLGSDAFYNIYYPFVFDGGDTLQPGWSVYAKETGPAVKLMEDTTGGTGVLHAVPELVSPPYRFGSLPTDDFPGTPNPALPDTYPRAENAYVLRDGVGDDTTVERYELIQTSASVGTSSPRAQALLAVSNGKIKRFDSVGGIQSPAGATTLPQPELDANAQYIDSAILFGKVYFADGISYRVYDPRNDIVTAWEAQDAGSLPNRCKLLANWRGRAVLARGADDPHNWHMSEQGAPNNWDNFPPVSTATQAISGNNARAGLCPDLVNSLIPYNDDLLLFGCDSSLWMMRGDPMAGGVFDLVSDVTGVAFGRSWAKDPEGNLYFFGSRGGVYIMKPGSIPISMTQATIERRLTEVDLGQFYVEMFWNTYDDGLHLFLMPFTDTATHTKHFFWERRTGAWFQDEFGPVGNTAKQPSAAIVVDGDAPDDRCLLIGSYDASLLKWDKNAVNDDSQIINSRVLIGPIAPDDTEMESRVMNLAAVLSNQGAVNYRLYASQTPDLKGEPVANGTLVPGRNPIHLVRARGAYVWIELGQANAATRWAMESLRMDAYPAGRKRNA
jgi:hypothetical protein